jgi:hypothetical protein
MSPFVGQGKEIGRSALKVYSGNNLSPWFWERYLSKEFYGVRSSAARCDGIKPEDSKAVISGSANDAAANASARSDPDPHAAIFVEALLEEIEFEICFAYRTIDVDQNRG